MTYTTTTIYAFNTSHATGTEEIAISGAVEDYLSYDVVEVENMKRFRFIFILLCLHCPGNQPSGGADYR